MLGAMNSRLAAVETVSKPITHTELESVTKQRQAETHFANQLINIGQLKPEQIARKLLVDDSFKQSKRELQLVVVLDQEIVVFSINTWSGTYKPGPDGKFWLKRTEYEESITVEQIKSPLVELQEQVTLLHAHLIKSGAGVTKSQVKGFLVFTNDEIKIDDEVKDHNSILIGSKVTKYISSLQKTWGQYILDPFKPSILTGALSYKQIASSSSGLKKVGSWDKIGLTGGRVVEGNYKSCASVGFDRSNVSRMTFVHNRNSMSGKIYAVAGYIPSVTIQLEKRGGKAGWITGKELFSSVEVPFNTDLVFHFAGEQKEATIPVNEIEYIILC